MNKRELDLLERIFAKEIIGSVYQTDSKLAKKLEEEGYITKIIRIIPNDNLPSIKVEGYVLTYLGNYTYCSSGRCDDIDI